MLQAADEPYCGAPPLPADVLIAWNTDPYLLGALAISFAAGSWFLRSRGGLDERRRRRYLQAGFLALLVTSVSPLCALSSALFAARVTHHVVLISLAAPLLALAFPKRSAQSAAWLGAATLGQILAVWFWHAPQPYAAALSSHALYWLMEASLLLAAFVYWREAAARTAATLFAHLTFVAQMGLLGALITFAPAPLYTPHFLSTTPFGLSALEDQQLAGLIMWVPAIVPYLVAALAGLVGLTREDARPEGSRT